MCSAAAHWGHHLASPKKKLMAEVRLLKQQNRCRDECLKGVIYEYSINDRWK